jgi:transcriptional regulator with XRE-family HTH domain
MNTKEKLEKITSANKSNWLREAEEKLANNEPRKNARILALRVLHILREQEISQSELAGKMGVSRQQVTKIVKGEENFTFETVDKLEKALGITLMTIFAPGTPVTVRKKPEREAPVRLEEEFDDQVSIAQALQHLLDTDAAITKEQRAALGAAKSAVKKGKWTEAIRHLLPWLGTAGRPAAAQNRTSAPLKPDMQKRRYEKKHLKGKGL